MNDTGSTPTRIRPMDAGSCGNAATSARITPAGTTPAKVGVPGTNAAFIRSISLELPATQEQLDRLKVGDFVQLTGTIYTMRDVGHLRALEHLRTHFELPFGLSGQAIFYAGPTPQRPIPQLPTPQLSLDQAVPEDGTHPEPTGGDLYFEPNATSLHPESSVGNHHTEPTVADLSPRPFGAIGPTTASRMDFATPQLLSAGIKVMLGKGPRSIEVVHACKACGSVYLATTGGAAAYLAGFVRRAEMIAYEDLGTEALQKLTVHDLPAFVAIDTYGNDLYASIIS